MRRAACGALAAVASVSGAAIAVPSHGATTPLRASGAGYARIATGLLDTGQGPLLVGDQVLVGSARRGKAVVRIFGLDGSRREVVRVPDAARTVFEMAASDHAVAVMTGTAVDDSAAGGSAPGVSAAFGPLSGPLRAFPSQPSDVAVAGPLVVAVEYDRPDRILVWDVSAPGAAPREIVAPGATLFSGAAGHHVAVLAGTGPRLELVVYDLRDGREVYRVPARRHQDEEIGPDGRVVMLELARGGIRIVTATPAEPVRREVAWMPLYTPRLAVTESGVAVVRKAPGGLAQVVLVGYDGARRAVTPALNGMHALDYDGTRLAFTAGSCVFAGPVPAGPPSTAPHDPCFVAPARLDFARLGRFAQKRGRRVRVPLTCTAPPNNDCTAHLRLTGPGFTVHRRTRITPGRHVVPMRIPAARRRAAWRRGMHVETRQGGRGTAGAAIPQ